MLDRTSERSHAMRRHKERQRAYRERLRRGSTVVLVTIDDSYGGFFDPDALVAPRRAL
jgi:hypothetical protein